MRRGLPGRAAPCCSSSSTASPRGARKTSPRWSAICARQPARCEIRIAADDARARPAVEGAQGGVRRDGPHQPRSSTCRTASCRGRSCPRCCAGSPSSAREHGLRVANVFHAGDGNLHPLVLYDERVEGEAERRGASWRARSSSLRRRRRQHHGRARRRHRQGVLDAALFAEADLATMQRLRSRVRPRRARQPRQGLPDAAPLRRGARPVPRSTRWRGPGLPSVSEASVGEAAGVLQRASADGTTVSIERGRRGRSRRAASTASSSTSPATSPASSRPGSALRADRGPRAARAVSRSTRRATRPSGVPLDNLSGRASHRFGTMRDLVIGVTVVLRDGTRPARAARS